MITYDYTADTLTVSKGDQQIVFDLAYEHGLWPPVVGNNPLRSMRLDAGLTQEELGKRLGLSKVRVSQLERAKKPSLAHLLRVRGILKSTLQEAPQ